MKKSLRKSHYVHFFKSGQEIKREGIRRSMRKKIGKLLGGNVEKAGGTSVEK